MKVIGLTGTIGADSLTLDGTLAYIFQSSTSFTATMDMRLRDNSTGKVHWISNYAMTISVAEGYVEFTVSGKFYHPNHGFVVISTPTPFRINSGQSWPSQGVMILTGKNSTKARLTVNSPPPAPVPPGDLRLERHRAGGGPVT